MNAYIGSLLIVSGLVFFIWSVQEYRRPAPPRWASRENYAIVFSVSVTAFLSLGSAATIHFFVSELHDSLGIIGWAGLAAIYGVLAASLAILSMRWRRISLEAPTKPAFTNNIVYPGPANDPAPRSQRIAA